MTQHGTAIKAVIFDMGGVLVRTEDRAPRAHLGKRYGLSYEQVDELVFGGPTAIAASVGEIEEALHWAAIGERFSLSPEQLADFRRDFWAGDRLNQELMDYIASLRPAIHTGLLSNAWSEVGADMQARYRLLDAFDVAVFSAEVKMAKPRPEIYHLILNRLEVQPGESIFVDDFLVNVEAARALGMHGVHFKETAQAIAEVQSLIQSSQS